MNGPRVGSLFSGYGGLEMGVHAVLGGTTVWVSDVDPGACKVLAHRYPDVPNLGDISTVDWDDVEPVDVLTGGFPCQDVSHAGARKGMGPGTRSGLWSRMADAIDHLRPSLVIAENVRGLLSAEAASDVEPCPWCLGDGAGEPPLRALGAVLADLAELGYDASWHGLRAADVGAPHGRFRVFVAAWPANSDLSRLEGAQPATGRVMPARGRLVSAADPPGVGPVRAGGSRRRGAGPADGHDAVADADHTADDGERPRLRPRLGGQGAAADPKGDGRDEGRPESAGELRGHDAAVSGHAAADADGDGLGGVAELDSTPGAGREGRERRDHADGLAVEPRGLDWGAYGPAIRRWERRVGRPAPAPTEHGKNGQPRLSPPFVEWMMGLPAGWVTEIPGLSRNDQLKALGNGVVPQQAAAAVRFMLARLAEERRWAA